MISAMVLVALASAPDCGPCGALARNNIFWPVVAPEPGPPPPPPPPPSPRRRPLVVAGLVYDTPSQAYYVLWHDLQWEKSVYLKPGESYAGVEVLEVGSDSARVRVEGQERTVRLGDRVDILDQGRPPEAVGRLAPRAPTSMPAAASAPVPPRAATSGESPLERMRRERERWSRRYPYPEEGAEGRRRP